MLLLPLEHGVLVDTVPAFDVSSVLGTGALLAILAAADRTILGHPVRMRILRWLALLPGDHFRSIVRALGVGEGDATYHLSVLIRKGFVRRHKTNGRCRYYLSGAGADLEKNLLFSRHWAFSDVRTRVLYAVRSQRVATPRSVGMTLGISRQLAAYHLNRLVVAGVVHRDHRCYRA